MIRLLLGDCRELLRSLPEAGAQACVTSPPYYGLRDYGTPPLVWGGDSEHEHVFGQMVRTPWANGIAGPSDNVPKNGAGHYRPKETGPLCVCGAWRGSHGLEPTPELYIEHEVDVFREVRRVLRDDGVLWVNLGDSYAAHGRMVTDVARTKDLAAASNKNGPSVGRVPGWKPKDLMLLPFRVAMALQADGWYLRSVIPWLKRNSMPESVQDRPSTSVEYVFLMTKSARYYWDADAVRMNVTGNAHARGDGINPKSLAGGYAPGQDVPNMPRLHRSKQNASFSAATAAIVSSRNRRNGDWFFESWQGLLGDESGEPLALIVNLQPFSGAHFATFPSRLVEPMVKASTRRGDTVLDPFCGSGTVGMVADRLERDSVLIDLNPDYHLMAETRVVQDAPMFVQLDAC